MKEKMASGEHETARTLQWRAGSGAGKRRVALLGAGYIADWHALALSSVEGVELAAVCDRVQARAEALARKFGVPRVYGSLEEMLALEHGLDAVHVLTPPDRHFDAARAVLGAGVGVFLEKPMCAEAADCAALGVWQSNASCGWGWGTTSCSQRSMSSCGAMLRVACWG